MQVLDIHNRSAMTLISSFMCLCLFIFVHCKALKILQELPHTAESLLMVAPQLSPDPILMFASCSAVMLAMRQGNSDMDLVLLSRIHMGF